MLFMQIATTHDDDDDPWNKSHNYYNIYDIWKINTCKNKRGKKTYQKILLHNVYGNEVFVAFKH